ncbi:hypothetical protein ACRAWG_15805 [Methylobacterium sp. P31]
MAFFVSDPVTPEPVSLAIEAEIVSEILVLRDFAPDLPEASNPCWLVPEFRAWAHRHVGARSHAEPV